MIQKRPQKWMGGANCVSEEELVFHGAVQLWASEEQGAHARAFLHRFQWLEDEEIGSIPFVWNFLEGHNRVGEGDAATFPKAIHYTRGGPWFEAL
ncbi:hypothetical protein OIU84_027502 [Salix udensis]|uniref:Uncharacterized protein n=1 Tax=Salix udensis TaxID=889485 RepID=A0AAD6PAG9_9ROSI|nr:hypothetical protein OIU84_027502 [Salix udensis]